MKYKQALSLGQTAFEAQDNTPKPVPHIFGSAAYLQDPLAGLGSPPPPQETHRVVVDSQQIVQHSEQAVSDAAAKPPPPVQPAPSVTGADSADSSVLLHQPQNFKAMLEAALKGDMYLPSDAHNDPHAEQPLHSLPPRAAPVSAVDRAEVSKLLQANDQPEGIESKATVTVPHVLAWLEQGRGLFDNDDFDDLEKLSVQSHTLDTND